MRVGGRGIDGGVTLGGCGIAWPLCPLESGGLNGGASRTGAAGASSGVFASCVSADGSATADALGLAGDCVRGGAEGPVYTGPCGAREVSPCEVSLNGALVGAGFRGAPGATMAGDGSGPESPVTRRRTCSATSSSSELECVFLSVIPSSTKVSRITFGFTSSSRASSLIRILLIR
jgi:hypothetical protein